MKILIIRSFPTEIDIYKYNVQEIGLARSLVDKGNQCGIVLFTNSENRTEKYVLASGKEITLYYRHGKNVLWQGFYNYKAILDIASSYDAIQVNEYNQLLSYYMAKNCAKPCVIYHGPYYNPNDLKYNFLTKIFDSLFLRKYINIDVRVLTKSILAEDFLKKKGFKSVKTVGVGLDIERLENVSTVGVDIARDYHELLYVGEVSRRRNTIFLLDVLSRIKERIPDIKLTIIGKGSKEVEDNLTTQIEIKELNNNIVWIKEVKQDELYKYYRRAGLFLFPTNYDIFGMVLLETMFFGLPCISSYNGGSETLLKDICEECIIMEISANKWCEKACELLGDKTAWTDISIKEKEKIINHYTWDNIATEFIDAYESFRKG